MVVRRKLSFAWCALITLVMSVALTEGCRERAEPGETAEVAGEPEQYSATVVRTVEDGTSRETIISREARAGEWRKEEWTENDGNRALIWRPDIGKAFLLDLDRRTYLEIDVGAGPLPESRTGAGNLQDVPTTQHPASLDARESAVQAIDQYFIDSQPPTRIETQALSPAVIDGHPCVVDQRKAIFPDGHTETIRRFFARDLSGLLLRVESETEQGRTKVITERRDVRIGVASDAFAVPTDFKRVEKLER